MKPLSDTATTLADLPVHRLAPMIAQGQVTPSALVEACLARIHATDPRLHAFVEVWEDAARAAARIADAEIAGGRYRGTLHGIPVGLKDLVDVAGRVTTAGSAFRRDHVAHQSATVATRLTEQGAILMGKLHMVEFAFGGWGTNQHLGTPWNPWDLATHRVPGGSSSGSGVAAAAGMVPIAIGSDTGGSIRIPAAMNGVVGLKPTSGLVSNRGIVPLSQTLDSIGPLTRSVEDAALALQALAGFDTDFADSARVADLDLSGLRAPIAGLRLGRVPDAQLLGASAEVLDGFAATVEVLRGLGAEIVACPLPEPPPHFCVGASVIIRTEAFANLRDIIDLDTQDFGAAVRARVRSGRADSGADYAAALNARRAETVAMRHVMRDVDAVILPTTPIVAPPLAAIDEDRMPLADFTRLANYLGLCGLAVPSGFTPQGQPLSLQIHGRAFEEAAILRIGWAFEQATPWHDHRPDLMLPG
jgi:aspartyl-tRNA(Asn)/glutamyl-tRNA(Gln) amidotransferase subunit A